LVAMGSYDEVIGNEAARSAADVKN